MECGGASEGEWPAESERVNVESCEQRGLRLTLYLGLHSKRSGLKT